MNINDIKKIRDITGISIEAIHQALLKADGKIEDALDLLKKSGETVSVKKSGRFAIWPSLPPKTGLKKSKKAQK